MGFNMKHLLWFLVCCALTNFTWALTSADDDCQAPVPYRQAYFGDLHVHTGYSLDAYSRMGVRTTPFDAYRFAQGEKIFLPPYDEKGTSLRTLTIDRPLDFAAVTDHAEDLADVRLCTDPEFGNSSSMVCELSGKFRTFYGMALNKINNWFSEKSNCVVNSGQCEVAQKSVWHDTISAAQINNQPCDFTTFIAYEWSGLQNGANMHRNVIFPNGQVLAKPLNAKDVSTPELLWEALDASCREGIDGCDAITIPHNMNLSQGRMFSNVMSDGEKITKEVAELRNYYERLAEVMQHKGDSECYYNAQFSADELCNFEKLPYSSFLGKYFPALRDAPKNDTRFMREALREGFRIENKLGLNPYKVGFIGGTDNHTSAPGAVAENAYAGNHGAQSIDKKNPVKPQLPDRVESNPGGLAVIYAEQNTRATLFSAMKRREAYGTSGPRIQVRFFAGDDLSQEMCDANNYQESAFAQQGYAKGVPMGSELTDTNNKKSGPSFAVAATQDMGTVSAPGNLLQRVQIIKGWVDDAGVSQEKVFDVAGNANNEASVNLESCTPQGKGFKQLCSVWQDPSFNPLQSAYYYSRVVENPSCRWATRVCVKNKVDCSNPDTVPDGLKGCCDASQPKTIQERAWTSPIWYSPKAKKAQ